MASYNKVMLMGNLTRDPQLRYIPSNNMPVVDFGIAMNRKFKGANGEEREEVTFVDISAFSKTAELINQYFTKGKPIFIEGRLKLDQWEDKNGGGKRSKVSVVCENFQFIGGRDGGGAGAGGGYEPAQSHEEYEQRPVAPARPAAARPPAARPPVQRPSAPAPAAQPPEQQPFSDESQSFEEGDIPF
jgi:single-strand DNA-binding protein